MKIQAVTVSVNYSDFLVHTLKENAHLFDKWIIVTDLKDHKTFELCATYKNVTCIQTDVFYTKGIFNKYAAINEGLVLVDNEWILFLDSDVVLPNCTKRILENVKLQEDFIYGIDRLNCIGLQQWIDYQKGPGILKDNWMLTTVGLEFGARLVHHYGHQGENGRFEGWRPLGYFQLCHRSAFNIYPQDTLGADSGDLEFARLWPRSKRILIPEIYVIHLESLRAGKGVNWYGRKSVPFTIEEKKEEKKPFFNKILNL